MNYCYYFISDFENLDELSFFRRKQLLDNFPCPPIFIAKSRKKFRLFFSCLVPYKEKSHEIEYTAAR